jgi:hypothetical protein
MHGIAFAPGYPSDSTRSLAGVRSQDGLRAAARTLATLTASSRQRATAYTMDRADRAGRSQRDHSLRAATFVCAAVTSDTTVGAPTCGRGWCRRSDDDQPRLRLPPSPPTAPHAAGDGAAWRASICGMWGLLPYLPAHSLWPASGTLFVVYNVWIPWMLVRELNIGPVASSIVLLEPLLLWQKLLS